MSNHLIPEYWSLVQTGTHPQLVREFKFNNFKSAWHHLNQIAQIAEKHNHHPDLLLKWGYLKVTTFSHDINDLSERDYKLAESINLLNSRI